MDKPNTAWQRSLFYDGDLRAIAQLNPDSLEALQTVPGIGPAKIASYGAAVIELLHGD